MTKTNDMEKWEPCKWIEKNTYILDKVSYSFQESTDLLKITIFPFNNKEKRYKITIVNIFSYRITDEHLLCSQYDNNDFKTICPEDDYCIYWIQNSKYIEELNGRGIYDLHKELKLLHYLIQTDLHIIDLLLDNNSEITISEMTNGILTKKMFHRPVLRDL